MVETASQERIFEIRNTDVWNFPVRVKVLILPGSTYGNLTIHARLLLEAPLLLKRANEVACHVSALAVLKQAQVLTGFLS